MRLIPKHRQATIGTNFQKYMCVIKVERTPLVRKRDQKREAERRKGVMMKNDQSIIVYIIGMQK